MSYQSRGNSSLSLVVTAADSSNMKLRMPYQEHSSDPNRAVSLLRLPADKAIDAGRSTLKAKLARSGHAQNVIGLKVVKTPRILPQGSLIVDVITVDLATMSVLR